ncbi:hypothetical protein AAF712_012010 [Marasmius tenuissimus]|uniref:Uncharacterized protein n=1 Tax=Marasmius tenuissimus TaxID=585030 RepID=A0ABR2ZIY2_9AGAR
MSSIVEKLEKYVQEHPNNDNAKQVLDETKRSGDLAINTLQVMSDPGTGVTWWLTISPERTLTGNGAGAPSVGGGSFRGVDVGISSTMTSGQFTLTIVNNSTLTLELTGTGPAQTWRGAGTSSNLPGTSTGEWSG